MPESNALGQSLGYDPKQLFGRMKIRKKIFDAIFSGWAKKIFYVNQGGAKMHFTIFSLVE